MMRFILLLMALCSTVKAVEFKFIPVYNGEKIVLNKPTTMLSQDTISFKHLSWYISNFQILHQDSVILKDQKRFRLMNLDESQSLTLTLPEFSKGTHLTFILGIDSIGNTNTDFTGDLDPLFGMYWTWNSGYINFKAEGLSTACDTRKHEFQLHLGGYRSPYASFRRITIPLPVSQDIIMDIGKLIEKGIEQDCNVMSPGNKAYSMSSYFSTMFGVTK